MLDYTCLVSIPSLVAIAYAMGYALAGFTTFVTILGRYGYGFPNKTMRSCCSVLEQESDKGFVLNVGTTLRSFAVGLGRLLSLIILITAESICILTAETVDLIFYRYSILLSVPLALLKGAFAVIASEDYRKMKSTNQRKRQ